MSAMIGPPVVSLARVKHQTTINLPIDASGPSVLPNRSIILGNRLRSIGKRAAGVQATPPRADAANVHDTRRCPSLKMIQIKACRGQDVDVW